MYSLYYFLIVIFSKLPFGVLYIFSDFFSIINYYLINYRKSTVQKNIKRSFPKLSTKEIDNIVRKFYRNFGDYIIETIKLFKLTKSELQKIHTHSGIEYLMDSYKNKKNVILLCGHFFNWEYHLSTGLIVPQKKKFAIYKRISNKFWNQKINEMRERFSIFTIELNDSPKFLLKIPNNGENIFLIIADQSPHKSQIHHDLIFLNQKTPVFNGFDKIVRKRNFDVIYLSTKRIKRNRYHSKFIKIDPKNKIFEENEVTKKFFELLEKDIISDPSNWLWSHKRWKYSSGKDYII